MNEINIKFYEELKKQRNIKKISLEEISDYTKINIKYLDALESKNTVQEEITKYEGTLTRAITAGIFYDNCELTQKETCELFGISLPRLKRALKVIRNG